MRVCVHRCECVGVCILIYGSRNSCVFFYIFEVFDVHCTYEINAFGVLDCINQLGRPAGSLERAMALLRGGRCVCVCRGAGRGGGEGECSDSKVVESGVEQCKFLLAKLLVELKDRPQHHNQGGKTNYLFHMCGF